MNEKSKRNTPGEDPAASDKLTREDLLDVLRNVMDPDLQMNIVDLGLVYEAEHLDDGRVSVKMTLTTPHCPYGPALIAEVKAMLLMVRGVTGVQVDLVWDPPWGTERLTEEGRLALGLDI